MSGSIARKFYQQFLRLYPKPFRHEFGEEILSLFDECRPAQGSWRLLADVLLSTVKQQIRSRSTPVTTSLMPRSLVTRSLVHRNTPLYSEIDLCPHLARRLGVAALGASLTASVWIKGIAEAAPESWTVIRPEVIYWFPTIPQGRYCYGPPEGKRKRERVLTTGVWVRGNPEAPEYWTVVRSKTAFWISTAPWGQYCWDVPERTGRPEGVQ